MSSLKKRGNDSSIQLDDDESTCSKRVCRRDTNENEDSLQNKELTDNHKEKDVISASLKTQLSGSNDPNSTASDVFSGNKNSNASVRDDKKYTEQMETGKNSGEGENNITDDPELPPSIQASDKTEDLAKKDDKTKREPKVK